MRERSLNPHALRVIGIVLIAACLMVIAPSVAAAAGWFRTGVVGEPPASHLIYPYALATAADGTLWVADPFSASVKRYSASGSYLSSIQRGGATDDEWMPLGVAAASDGSVWILDATTHSAIRLGADGHYLDSWDAGPLPRAIAVAPDGTLLVSDWLASSITRFSTHGDVVATYSGAPGAPGGMLFPTGIDVRADGTFWFADLGTSRVQHLDANGGWIEEVAANVPFGVAASPDGSIWVASVGASAVQHYAHDGTPLGSFGSAGKLNGQFLSVYDVDLDAAGRLLVTDGIGSRIQRFTTGGAWVQTIGTAPPTQQLRVPEDAVHRSDGGWWVVDHELDGLRRFSSNGAHVSDIAGSFSQFSFFGDNGFRSIDEAPDGSVWTTDNVSSSIRHHSATGALLATFGSAGAAPGQFDQLLDIAVAADGSIYTVEAATQRIQHLSSTGVPIAAWGASGHGDGQFVRPAQIDIGASGDIYVLDVGDPRVQRFTSSGVHLDTIAVPGFVEFLNTSARPSFVVAPDERSIVVADTLRNTIRHIGMDGAAIETFTVSAGRGVGIPTGLSFDHAGDLVVSEAGSDRVSTWRRDAAAPSVRATATGRRGKVTFRVTAADAGSGLADSAYSFDGGVTWRVGSSFTVRRLAPGARVSRTIKVRDAVGNVSAGIVRSARSTADTTPPAVRPPTAIAGGVVDASRPVISFHFVDGQSAIVRATASFRGRSIPVSDGRLDTRLLPEGRGVLRVRVVNAAGFVTVYKVRLSIDRTAPRVGARTRFVLGATAAITGSDRVSGGGSGTVVRGLDLGVNVRQVLLRDRAGNGRRARLRIIRRLSLAHPELNGASAGSAGSAGSYGAVFGFQPAGGMQYPNGARSPRLVRELQWRLQRFGALSPVYRRTGVLDWVTVEAIKRYQRRHSLAAIGTAGPRTRAMLDRQLIR